jgi:hypothetical protein
MDLVTAQIANQSGPKDLYFVFRNPEKKENILTLDWAYFDNGKQTTPSL